MPHPFHPGPAARQQISRPGEWRRDGVHDLSHPKAPRLPRPRARWKVIQGRNPHLLRRLRQRHVEAAAVDEHQRRRSVYIQVHPGGSQHSPHSGHLRSRLEHPDRTPVRAVLEQLHPGRGHPPSADPPQPKFRPTPPQLLRQSRPGPVAGGLPGHHKHRSRLAPDRLAFHCFPSCQQLPRRHI